MRWCVKHCKAYIMRSWGGNPHKQEEPASMDGLVIHELLFMCKSIIIQVRIGTWSTFRYSLLNERSNGHPTGCSICSTGTGLQNGKEGHAWIDGLVTHELFQMRICLWSIFCYSLLIWRSNVHSTGCIIWSTGRGLQIEWGACMNWWSCN